MSAQHTSVDGRPRRERHEISLRPAAGRPLFDHLPIGLVRWELGGDVVDANPALVSMLGVSALDDLRGIDASERILDAHLADLEHQILAGRYGPFDITILRTDGGTLPVRVHAAPAVDDDGRTLVEAAVEDLSGTHRAQDALQGAEARFRDIFESSPIALWEEDFSAVHEWLNGVRAGGVSDLRAFFADHPEELDRAIAMVGVRNVNQAVLDLVGVESKEALLGGLNPQWITSDSRRSLLEQFVAVWDGRSRISIEAEGSTADGIPIDIVINWAAPVIDGLPDYGRVVVAIADQTARRRREREVERQNESLTTLYDTARRLVGTLSIDDAMRILCVRSSHLVEADRVIGVLGATDRDDAVSFDTLPPRGGGPVVLDGIAEWVLQHGRGVEVADVWEDERNRGRDLGASFHAHDGPGVFAPLLTGDRVLGVICAVRRRGASPFTPSDLLRLEMLASMAVLVVRNTRLYEQTVRSHRELERVIDELGRTQAQLLQAQRLESIGELASGIAHEINTPIQYVGDNTRFLGDAALELAEVAAAARSAVEAWPEGDAHGAEQRDRLRRAVADADLDFLLAEVPSAVEQTIEGVTRVASIIRALKEFAHPAVQQFSPADLNHSVETTLAVSHSEYKHVADVVTSLHPDLPRVPVQIGPLNQALLNIVVNAAHAVEAAVSDGGRGTITVATGMEGDDAVITVADTGCGIDPAIVDRIFDPFFTTKDVGKGSGQGLAIAHNVVVDKHGGSLEVDSAPGAGSTFTIRLPLARTCEQEEGT